MEPTPFAQNPNMPLTAFTLHVIALACLIEAFSMLLPACILNAIAAACPMKPTPFLQNPNMLLPACTLHAIALRVSMEILLQSTELA